MTDEAPYGFKPDGTPYKRNPAAYANRTPRGSKGSKRSLPGRQTRKRALEEFLDLPVGILAITGQLTGQAPLVADAIVCGQAAPQVAESVADLAESSESLARAVDSLTKVTPYTALLGCLVPLAIQIGVNHSPRMAAVAKSFGFPSPEQIILSRVGGADDADGSGAA